MRELILKMFMSLDGFVGSTDGNPAALMPPPDPVGKAWNAERAWDTSLHVVGSGTFQMWAGYWPTSTDGFAAPDEPDSQGRLFQTGNGDPGGGPFGSGKGRRPSARR